MVLHHDSLRLFHRYMSRRKSDIMGFLNDYEGVLHRRLIPRGVCDDPCR